MSDAANPNDSETNPKPPIAGYRVAWSQLLGVGSAFIAVATVLLHMIGVVAHQFTLLRWGVDSDLFPKSTDWLLIHGYYVVIDRFAATIKAIQAELLWSLLAALGLSVYVAFLLWLGEIDAPSWSQVTSGWPKWIRGFARRIALTFLTLLLFPICLFALTLLLSLPSAMGEYAAESIASRQAADFAKGCGKSKARCVELRRQQVPLVRGYILDSSPTHLAIYDVSAKRAMTLPRDGVETVAVDDKP